MNFSLEQNVDILSAYHVERFTYLRDNEQNSIKMLMPLLKNTFVMAKLKMTTISGYM